MGVSLCDDGRPTLRPTVPFPILAGAHILQERRAQGKTALDIAKDAFQLKAMMRRGMIERYGMETTGHATVDRYEVGRWRTGPQQTKWWW